MLQLFILLTKVFRTSKTMRKYTGCLRILIKLIDEKRQLIVS